MSQIGRGRELAEGKTKIIWAIPDTPNEVLIENRDDITAGDGVKHATIDGKGVLATETTCNCFQLLQAHGISTHFIERVDERTFRALRLNMMPVEWVARRIATGSYLKRRPWAKEGAHFEELVIELFLKDDERHDPLMAWREKKQCFRLYDAKKPRRSKAFIEDLPPDFPFVPQSWGEIEELRDILAQVFPILERAWAQQNVTLVDLKVEFGYAVDNQEFQAIVGDVIDNGSWRIWPEGKKKKQRDKQVFRDSEEISPEALERVKENYAWVAAATRKFVD